MRAQLAETRVMCVVARTEQQGIREAWDQLEAPLDSFLGRRFYGVRNGGEYRACVAIEPGDDPADLGLEEWTIPGGTYVSTCITEWPRYTHHIKKRFASLERKADVDRSRPEIEYYVDASNLILYLPVQDG